MLGAMDVEPPYMFVVEDPPNDNSIRVMHPYLFVPRLASPVPLGLYGYRMRRWWRWVRWHWRHLRRWRWIGWHAGTRWGGWALGFGLAKLPIPLKQQLLELWPPLLINTIAAFVGAIAAATSAMVHWRLGSAVNGHGIFGFRCIARPMRCRPNSGPHLDRARALPEPRNHRNANIWYWSTIIFNLK